jgi:hypothetical protein
VSAKASVLFSLARKVPKEHTAIQERSLLSALLPSERLYVMDRGDFIIYFRIRENHSKEIVSALTPHPEQGRSPKGEAHRRRFGVRALFFSFFYLLKRKGHMKFSCIIFRKIIRENTMVAYKPNEMMSSTDVAKNFGAVLSKLANHEVDKIGVLKNNKLDFVLMRNDELENLIEQEIQQRQFEADKRMVARQVEAIRTGKVKLHSLDEAEKMLDDALARYED